MNSVMEVKNKKTGVEYRELSPGDALKAALLHVSAFPDYFLTGLGIEFLKRYYEELIEQNKESVGAYSDNQLAGFIIGGSNLKPAQSNFYKRNFLFCFFSVGISVITSMHVRRGIFQRWTYLLDAIRSKIISGNDNFPADSSNYRILSIAVYPEFKGSGIAAGMLNKFNDDLSLRQVESYGLTVKKDNRRAILFYRKSGMAVEKENDKIIYFRKWLGNESGLVNKINFEG